MLHYFNEKGWDELASKYFSYMISVPMAILKEQREQVFRDLVDFGEAHVHFKYPMTPDEATPTLII